MSPLVCSLLTLTALLAAADAGVNSAMFGMPTTHFRKLKELMLPREGGSVSMKKVCHGELSGALVIAFNDGGWRQIYIEGDPTEITVSCDNLDRDNCLGPIRLRIVQFCKKHE